MRSTFLALTASVLILGGCQSGQQIETRTHTVAPWQAAQLPAWEDTIESTVAPEKWNAEGSPHHISVDGNHLTVRTTKTNQEAILKYLATVATKS